MNYRLLVKDKHKYYNDYRLAKGTRQWFLERGICTSPVEVNCPVHGWYNTLAGRCIKCKALTVREGVVE